ncbi:hypothetical protein F4677DRAFT_231088 [Hypoxylon crocopeplum]|nr:hypothetical protein F4677DRAFT_231088 [Hypoxylon crocopeplum]
MSAILNTITSSWAKSPAPGSVNGDKEPRGTKRKAISDPYDDIDDDDSVQKTHLTQRTKSRISSEAPSSSVKGRSSSSVNPAKRRGRTPGVRKSNASSGSRADAAANLARAQEPQAARLHPQAQPEPNEDKTKSSLVPVADMGVPELSNDSSAGAAVLDGPSNAEPEPVDEARVESDAKGKAKAVEPEVNEAEDQEPEFDLREEHEVHALLEHRMAQDHSGKVELLVHWVGEGEDDATWELEQEIQEGAEEILYAYWRAQGGRMNALFIKPRNPPPETYHVYSILNHKKKARGGFELEVQWVGHPTTRGETSMEAETKLRNIAPEALDEYWKSVGGREQFLAKRGRGKK